MKKFAIIFLLLFTTLLIPSFIMNEFDLEMPKSWIFSFYLIVIILYVSLFVLIGKINSSSLKFMLIYNLFVCTCIQLMYYLLTYQFSQHDLYGLNLSDDLFNVGRFSFFLVIYLAIVLYDRYRFNLSYPGFFLGFVFGILLSFNIIIAIIFAVIFSVLGFFIHSKLKNRTFKI